jgi:TetR/AcrR family transcriptional regulator, mexJK operon transcriptional repressor
MKKRERQSFKAVCPARAADARKMGGKRAAILTAATGVFLDAGYGAASMVAIARAARVSKQTVYSHFGGKAALFEAIIANNSGRMLEALEHCDAVSTDPAETLEAIGQRLLDIILAPDALARFRVVMAESARFPELANIYYRTGPERVTAGLAAYLATLHERKLLRVPDPLVAASQFFGMVRGNLFIRGLLRIEPLPSADDLRRFTRAAVRAFLLAHQPEEENWSGSQADDGQGRCRSRIGDGSS